MRKVILKFIVQIH